jgi:NitT/TauT family transport system substrate-binding protein
MTLRIGYFPNILHAPALINRDTGNLENDLKGVAGVRWVRFQNGPGMLEAIFADEIDLGYMGPVPAVTGYIRSKGEIKVIAGSAQSGSALIIRKNLLIHSISDLNGKKLAVPQFGNTQDLILRKILESASLKIRSLGGTVDVYQADGADIRTLMDLGYLDGALVPEPWVSRLEDEIQAKVLLDQDTVSENRVTAILVSDLEFYQNHPEIIRIVIESQKQAVRLINSKPEESRNRVNRQLKILTRKELKSDVLNRAFGRVVFSTEISASDFETVKNDLIRLRYLRTDADISGLTVGDNPGRVQ